MKNVTSTCGGGGGDNMVQEMDEETLSKRILVLSRRNKTWKCVGTVYFNFHGTIRSSS